MVAAAALVLTLLFCSGLCDVSTCSTLLAIQDQRARWYEEFHRHRHEGIAIYLSLENHGVAGGSVARLHESLVAEVVVKCRRLYSASRAGREEQGFARARFESTSCSLRHSLELEAGNGGGR